MQGIECEIVTQAVIRYMIILEAEAHTPGPRDPGDASANLPALVINVTGTCENMPHLDMVETCKFLDPNRFTKFIDESHFP